jgi:hypothetical protein
VNAIGVNLEKDYTTIIDNEKIPFVESQYYTIKTQVPVLQQQQKKEEQQYFHSSTTTPTTTTSTIKPTEESSTTDVETLLIQSSIEKETIPSLTSTKTRKTRKTKNV